MKEGKQIKLKYRFPLISISSYPRSPFCSHEMIIHQFPQICILFSQKFLTISVLEAGTLTIDDKNIFEHLRIPDKVYFCCKLVSGVTPRDVYRLSHCYLFSVIPPLEASIFSSCSKKKKKKIGRI